MNNFKETMAQLRELTKIPKEKFGKDYTNESNERIARLLKEFNARINSFTLSKKA